MKSTLFRPLTALYRVWLYFAIRSVEITIDGQTTALECIGDKLLQGRIVIARLEARRELARLRARYNATLPPGRRVTWRLA